MSGGYFDYVQHRLAETVDKLKDLRDIDPSEYEKSAVVYNEICELIKLFKDAEIRISNLDYFLEADFSLKTYLKILEENDGN